MEATIIKQDHDHLQALAKLRDRAENDPDEEVRKFAIQQVVKIGKNDPNTLPWLKTRLQLEKNAAVIYAAVQIMAAGWKDDIANLNWFKTYSQYSQNPVVRGAAAQALARNWRDEVNVFEILCKCAIGDSFVRKQEEEDNPRQQALEAIAEQYPNCRQTLGLLQDLAENDLDEKVREFAKNKLAKLKE